MPTFVNSNSHPVRVRDGDGRLQRVRAGEVVKADGAYADRLGSTPGVESATSEHEERWEAQRESEHTRLGGTASRLAAKDALTGASVALASARVVAPLQRVIGDDQAPYGPPTGTITTKSGVALKGQVEREAFADHEALEPVPADDEVDARLGGEVPSSQAVHNAQYEARKAADEVAKAQLSVGDDAEGADGSSDAAEAASGDESASSGDEKPKGRAASRKRS